MGFAAKAFDLKTEIAGVQSVTRRGRWLCWSLETEHMLVPRFTRQTVGFLARLSGPLRRCSDGAAIDAFA
jgi:hypothetical protein